MEIHFHEKWCFKIPIVLLTLFLVFKPRYICHEYMVFSAITFVKLIKLYKICRQYLDFDCFICCPLCDITNCKKYCFKIKEINLIIIIHLNGTRLITLLYIYYVCLFYVFCNIQSTGRMNQNEQNDQINSQNSDHIHSQIRPCVCIF